jgi:hypothetical protein
MKPKIIQVSRILMVVVLVLTAACQKTGTIPSTPRPAALTVVNLVPGSTFIIPVINSGSAITYFSNAFHIPYGNFEEYSPPGGMDTTYVVQGNDTLDIGPKTSDIFLYDVSDFKPGGIYSLFLTGADTNSPDYLLTIDSIPYYEPSDSVMGIRFANLSTGSNPISVNLEGSSNGSEVSSLPYKGITTFKQYVNNSTTTDFLFVIRDAATGDSLTQFDFLQSGSFNDGYGLTDPNNSYLLTFKNVTIAIFGSESATSAFPLQTALIDDY